MSVICPIDERYEMLVGLQTYEFLLSVHVSKVSKDKSRTFRLRRFVLHRTEVFRFAFDRYNCVLLLIVRLNPDKD